uniref:Family with sequence similarity 170 member A n=1 Tax=Rousettus aegyptiacus TaxID=9407 RepID=A0A7J8EY98_ROUAE|nr:family with sequence similarity 170 member A [Rousettus aegyptiacus]
MKRQQKRKHLENEESQDTAEKGGGISKSQEDAPQLESTEVAKGCGPGAGEVSSASEYFSCVSSPHKLLHGATEIHGPEDPGRRCGLFLGKGEDRTIQIVADRIPVV